MNRAYSKWGDNYHKTKPVHASGRALFCYVGTTGFEPVPPCSQRSGFDRLLFVPFIVLLSSSIQAVIIEEVKMNKKVMKSLKCFTKANNYGINKYYTQ